MAMERGRGGLFSLIPALLLLLIALSPLPASSSSEYEDDSDNGTVTVPPWETAEGIKMYEHRKRLELERDRMHRMVGVLDSPIEYFHLRAGPEYEHSDALTLQHHQEQLLLTDKLPYKYPRVLAFIRYYIALANLRDENTIYLVAAYVWEEIGSCETWNLIISLGTLPSCVKLSPYSRLTLQEAECRMRLPLVTAITTMDKMRRFKVSRHLYKNVANATRYADEIDELYDWNRQSGIERFFKYEKWDNQGPLHHRHGEKEIKLYTERVARFLDRLTRMSQSDLPEWLDRFDAADPPQPDTVWDTLSKIFTGK